MTKIDNDASRPSSRPPPSAAWCEHLRERTDVQNIDLMNLAGFCRNCLANWYQEAADEQGRRAHQGRRPRDRLRHALQGVAGQAPEGGDPEQKAAFAAGKPHGH